VEAAFFAGFWTLVNDGERAGKSSKKRKGLEEDCESNKELRHIWCSWEIGDSGSREQKDHIIESKLVGCK
jgi:hypothetical protein